MKKIVKELIKIGKKSINKKLVVDTGGNISVRIGNKIFIKKKGTSLGSSKISDYTVIDFKTGKSYKGMPSSEKYMHIACYKKRKDINTVLHFHPVFSTAVSNSRIKLGAVSYELCATLASDLVRAKYKPSGSKTLANEISKLIIKHNAILMPNHGIIVVGENPAKAFKRALAVERACKTLVFSKLLGLTKFLPKNEARRIMRIYGKK